MHVIVCVRVMVYSMMNKSYDYPVVLCTVDSALSVLELSFDGLLT